MRMNSHVGFYQSVAVVCLNPLTPSKKKKDTSGTCFSTEYAKQNANQQVFISLLQSSVLILLHHLKKKDTSGTCFSTEYAKQNANQQLSEIIEQVS